MTDAGDEVLVLQVKSFLSPSNMLTMDRADRDVSKGIEQCRKADNNKASVVTALQEAFKIKFLANWLLRQIIVVEGVTGSQAADVNYPVVSVEWFESEAPVYLNKSTFAPLWNAALQLPDQAPFLAQVGMVYELVDDEKCAFKTGSK